MEQYRNWKVNLVLLMKDKVESDTQIDLINTVTDVTRVVVNREGYLEEEIGVAAYDILGNTGGKDYTIRVYATLKDVTRIGEMIHDNTTQAGLLNIIGYEIDLDRTDLEGFNLSGGYPDINPDNTLLPEDFCREADYTIRLQDEFGNPLCARIGTLPVITLEPGPTTIYRGWLWVEPGYTATDAEDGDLTEHVLVESSLNVNVLGSYIIRYTVTDTDSQTVTVIRTINVIVPDLVPVLTLLPNMSGSITPINIIEGDEFIDPGVLAQDAEDGDISASVVVEGEVLNNIPGSYIVTYTVTDSAGNVNHMDRVINVLANTMPIITLYADADGIVTPIIIPAGHSYTDPGFSAIDTEDGDITNNVIVAGDTVDTSVEGNYTVSYTVTDNNGGTSVVYRVVQVTSNTLPTITLLPDSRGDSAVLVLQLGHLWVDPGYTATDIEDGDISNQVLINGNVDSSILGTNVITYTVTDSADNTVTANRTITVIDPVLSLSLVVDESGRSSPIYVLETNDSSAIVDPGVTATVTIAGVTTDASASVVVTRDIPTVLLAGDTGTITYTLVDQYGMNSTTITRVIKGVAVPTITMLAPPGQLATPITAVEDSGLVVPGATARNYLLQDITSSIVVSGDVVDVNTPGTYTVVYTVSDALGLTTTATRIVNILSNTVPSLTLLPDGTGNISPLNLPYGLTFTDPGATAFDPEDGDISSSIVVVNPVDVNVAGTYTIDYSVTDTSGVTILATRTVNVAENIGPSISLTGGSPYEIVENIPWSDPGYVAIDAEQGNITADVVISGDAVDTTVVGTYNLLYTVVDQGGLTATATRTVNVVVNTAPVITLAGDEPYKRLVGPTWVEPGYIATDSEDGDISAAVTITGTVDTTTIGAYGLSYSVTDTSGTNTTVERQVFILSDANLAIAMRNPQTGPPASPMEWNIGDTWVDPGADVYNPEGETINQYLITTGTVDSSVVGENTITYTATDNYGRTDTVTRTVNVVLVNLEPTIGLSGGDTVEWVLNTPWVEPGYTAYDVEDGDITANVVVTGDDFDISVEGTNYINYVVTDSGGKSASAERTVIVVPPNIAPVITLVGGDIVVPNSPNDFSDPGYTASDTVDGDLTSYVVVGGDVVDRSINGTYLITYDVTDSGGLTAHAERIVTVTPDLVPTITLTASTVNLLVNTPYTEPGYTAWDNEDGDITGAVFVDDGGLDTSIVGAYTITYTVTDSVGHTTTATRTVNIVATDTPPTITLLGDNPQNMPQYTSYIEQGYYATDVIDGNITSQIVITDDINTDVFGTYTRTYTVTDSGGNTTTVDRTVIVDFVNKLPVITLTNAGSIYWPNGLAWAEPGFSAMDVEDGDITADVIIGGDAVDTSTNGDYSVVYTVTDSNGGISTITRIVHVVTNTPPAITLLEDPEYPGDPAYINIIQGTIWTDPGATAIDGEQGDLTSSIVVAGDVIDKDTVASYNVTYSVTDNMGVTTTVTRVVNYTANQVPTIFLTAWTGQTSATTTTLPWGTTWVEPGYTATDTEDGVITSDVIIAGDTVDGNVAGTYVITYSVTDSYGQTTTVNRTVIILQNATPVITLEAPATGFGTATAMWLYTNSTYIDPGYTASDAEDGDITASVIVAGDVVDNTVAADYVVTYSVTDSFGNSNTVTRTVTVHDNVVPEITLLGDDPQYILQNTVAVDPGYTALDTEDGDITASVVRDAYPDTSILGTSSVAYQATDSQGGVGTALRTVVISPDTPPTITLTGDNPLTLEATGDLYIDPGFTSTSVDGVNITTDVVVGGDTVDTNTIGTYTISYVVTDYLNRTTTVTRTVEIIAFNNPPVVTPIGASPYFIEVGVGTYTELGATASDVEDGDITSDVIVAGATVNTSVEGNYYVTYNVSDSGGKWGSATRTVSVVAKPTITLLGDNGGQTDPVYLLLNATPTWTTVAKDFTGATDTDGPTTVSTVDATTVGDYTETYDYVDQLSGVSATQVVRVVHVVDSLATTITLLGSNPLSIALGGTYTDPGYTASDLVAGDVTADVTIGGDTVDTSVEGNYNVTYTFTNVYGITTTETRVVTVSSSTTALGITIIGDNPTYVTPVVSKTVFNTTGADAYAINDSTKAIVINDNKSVDLPADGGSTVNSVFVHQITDLWAGQEHYIEVEFQRLNTGFSYYDQDHTDGAFQICFYWGATPEDVPDRGGDAWTYGSRTGVLEVDIPPTPSVPLGAFDHIWRDNANLSIGKTITNIVNDAVPAWSSTDVWKVRMYFLDSTHLELKVYVNDVLIKDHYVDVAVDPDYAPMTHPIKAITFKHHSYSRTSTESLSYMGIASGKGGTYTEQGATAYDAEDGDITSSIVIGGDTVDTSVPGTYVVSYTSTDADGNTVTDTRDVIVSAPQYLPSIWLNPDAAGNFTPSNITAADSEIVVLATGVSTDWWNDYMQTNILLVGDFEASYICTGDNTWIIADTNLTKTEWLSNTTGFGTDGAGQTVNHLDNWYTQVLPSGATTALGCTVGLRRVGATMSSFIRASDGTETTVDTACSTADMKLYLWQRASVPRNSKGLLVNGNPITDISSWTTSTTTDWDMTATPTYYDPGALAFEETDLDITRDIVVSGDVVDVNTPGTYTVVYTITASNGASQSVTREVIVS